MMERFVKQRLKAPSTADFPGVWDGRGDHVTYLGDQKYRVRSYVDSENSFGAMLRMNFVGEIQQVDEDTWELVQLQFLE